MDLSKQQQIRRTRNVREGLGIKYAINGYHEVLETHRRVFLFFFYLDECPFVGVRGTLLCSQRGRVNIERNTRLVLWCVHELFVG